MSEIKNGGTVFIINNKSIYSIWEGRVDVRLLTGRRIANELFSLESFAATSKPELSGAKFLAIGIVPDVRDLILETESILKESLEAITINLENINSDPLYSNIKISSAQAYFEKEIITHSWPLVNLFIRPFILADKITDRLRTMSKMGYMVFAEYKEQQRIYLKPLWKCMREIDAIVKSFHNERKRMPL